jgi:hypothetical protein
MGAATLAGMAILALGFAAAAAQDLPPAGQNDSRIRIGLTLGGTGLVSISSEYQRGDWAAELSVGTIGFRDLSIYTGAKRYLSSGRLRPVVGGGLWSLSVWAEEGRGSAVIARVPLAVDWEISGGHAAGVEVGLNRALWIDRLDPEDDRPASGNIVPFPSFYYRYGWER